MDSKNPKSALDIEGLEYDWLACDRDDHVALFSTSGGGYAPPEFLADTDAHDAAIEAILDLPETTAARFAPVLDPKYINLWLRVAERGVFAFDCNPDCGPYRIVAAPVEPCSVSQLPETVARVARQVRLRLRFAASTLIVARDLGGPGGPGGPA